ncbi:Acid ceramidase [Armadillidium nasatum]|uniref:ceramidase n=1 Tax=Armadillidium nasatum TaxID=96803 RepID=A0A5N5TPC3_9CRUS|nr:Acid ceramidase [Armadillidium nasatum]
MRRNRYKKFFRSKSGAKYFIISGIVCFVSTIFILCFCVQYAASSSHRKIPLISDEAESNSNNETNTTFDKEKKLLPKELAVWILKSKFGIHAPRNVSVHAPLAKTLPDPYYEEIKGIAEAGNLTVTQITMYNIFYEVFTVCTSIITQDPSGYIHHGRNLDFGLFLGWDDHNHTWIVAELLRPLVIQLEWYKNGSLLFESVSYTGFIGVITGIKKDKFSFSLDERFTWNGGYIGLLEWIMFKDHDQKWVSFLIREVMETAESYEEAKSNMLTPRLLAPCYLILSGIYPGQGCVITRYRNDYNLLELGSSKEGQGSWFLVETNYDHWKEPPFYDDRRTPAIKCLNEGGQNNTGWELIYNVLSTKPVLNKLTTYTTLMDSKKGVMRTWLRTCPDPCWPW